MANWIDRILAAVKSFNGRPLYPAIDFAVYRIFHIPLEGNPKDRLLLARIEATEYLFQAGLRRQGITKDKIQDLGRESGEFAQYYWTLVKDIPSTYELSARSREDILAQFRATLSRLRGQLGLADIERSSACSAFTSKLLHWTFPDAFPITDTRSRKGISQMSRDVSLPLKRSSISGCGGEYDKLLRFYLDIRHELREERLAVVLKEDEDDLPAGLKVRYSWLRVLDKAMWMLGSDEYR